jgi:hypothetical protein
LEYMNTNHYKNINKLVFEYSFDKDKSIPRFLKIIENLKKHFKNVVYTKVKQSELVYNYYPACEMVYCWERI